MEDCRAVTTRYQDGGIASHALPTRRRGAVPPQSALGPIRAIVLRTHYPDAAGLRQGLGVECDVLPYAPGARVMPRVPVAGGGGPRGVELWTPAPTTRNVRTGAPITVLTASVDGVLSSVDDLSDLDGDHVLVQFLGGRADDPVITSPLPHPRAAIRPSGTPTPISAGAAHPATPDAPCRYIRQAGTVVMVDRRGSVVVDTTAAPETSIGTPAAGAEPAANVVVQLGGASKLEIRVGGTVLVSVEGGQVQLGASPTMHPVLFERFKAFWDAHTLPTAFGPTGPPAELPSNCASPGVSVDA